MVRFVKSTVTKMYWTDPINEFINLTKRKQRSNCILWLLNVYSIRFPKSYGQKLMRMAKNENNHVHRTRLHAETSFQFIIQFIQWKFDRIRTRTISYIAFISFRFGPYAILKFLIFIHHLCALKSSSNIVFSDRRLSIKVLWIEINKFI